MRTCSVVRGAGVAPRAGDRSEPGDGVTIRPYLMPAQGAVHLTVAVCELAPGGHVGGHVHPFEESIYVLEGAPVLNLAGRAYALRPHDFALVPIAHGHAWSNASDAPARWLRVHAPQPRRLGPGNGVYAADGVEPLAEGAPVDELHPEMRLVGHFDETRLPAPGPILMPGYHGPNIQKVSIRMMVDELLGARHHTLFVVQFDPAESGALSAKEHYHPFEEMYFFVQGSATASFDGETTDVEAGDMVFAPVGSSHGYVNTGSIPVRWIEAQAPLPPAQNGFFFHSDWEKLRPLD